MKCRAPQFRIGCTSFTIPGEYIPAVRACAEYADDISLLITDPGPHEEYMISCREIEELRTIADGEGLTWNIHLPCHADFSSAESTKILESATLHAIERTLPLLPHTWVLHVCDESLLLPASPDYFSPGQTDIICASLARIGNALPSPEHLAIENLEFFKTDLLDEIVARTSHSRCFDIGHIWKDGLLPESLLPSWLPKIRICHLHGLAERDHRSLAHMPVERIDAILHPLWNAGFSQTITLEVFSLDDFLTSHQAILKSYDRYSNSMP